MSNSSPMARITWGRAVALALAGALALGACSGSGSSSSSVAPAAQPGSADAGAVAPAPAALGGTDQAKSAEGAVTAPDAARATVGIESPMVVTTVGMYLTVDDVRVAAAAIRGVAAGVGGVVLNETVNATDAAPTPQPATSTSKGTTSSAAVRQGNYGQIVLGVPADKVNATLDQLAKLGVEVQRTSNSDDVTTTYVDLKARIDNMQASVNQVRAYLAQAKDLAQMVTIEAEVTRRQADLDSLTGQLNALSKQVARSTVTVTFTSKPQTVTPEDTNPFLAGLASGWNAFVKSASTALTVLGALLPWLIAAAIVGVPLWTWSRRRQAARPQPAGAAAYANLPGMPPAAELVPAGASAAPTPAPVAPTGAAGPSAAPGAGAEN